jgi:hypothetical protein
MVELHCSQPLSFNQSSTSNQLANSIISPTLIVITQIGGNKNPCPAAGIKYITHFMRKTIYANNPNSFARLTAPLRPWTLSLP